jgi:hypothetical protein
MGKIDISELKEDVRLMENPHLWPIQGALPLKNRTQGDPKIPTFPRMGFLVVSSPPAGGPVQYFIFQDESVFEPEFDLNNVKRYCSAKEVVEDGWVVD